MSAHTTADPIARRITLDGFRVEVDASGCLAHAGGTFTRHASLPLAMALLVAEAVGLLERREMPVLMAVASRMAKRREPVAFWDLVTAACLESHKAGTRPADMPIPAPPVVKPAKLVQAWGAIDGRIGPVYLDAYGVLRHGG